jgi:predicted dithiol-disulfide oxidoreductase (DUF899 family)
MSSDASVIENHRVVSHDEWLAARTSLLAKEKAFTLGALVVASAIAGG